MKQAKGVIWKYKNSPARGVTWAAELRINGTLVCCYGQKNMQSAMNAAARVAEKIGWGVAEWEKITKGTRSMLKRREIT